MCIVDLKEGMWDRKEQVSMGNWNEQHAQSATSELLSDRLYVSHYKKCEYLYRSWNYWHLTMLHAKAMSVVVEYDMYLEVAEKILGAGGIWMSRWISGGSGKIWQTECWITSQVQGSTRGARRWDPQHNIVIDSGQTEIQGDLDNHEKNNQEIEAVREDLITAGDLEKAARGNGSWIYRDLLRLKKNINSVENGRNNGKTCVVCGEMVYSVYKLCGNKAMQLFPQKVKCSGKDCFVDYHSEVFLPSLGWYNSGQQAEERVDSTQYKKETK